MRCRRSGRPLHIEAGGAQTSVPLYTTEGGWLHIETAELVEDALRAKAAGFGGSKIKVGRPPKEDVARLEAVREAVGDGFEIMVDGNQGAAVDEAIRRARLYEPLDLAWYEEPMPAEDLGGHIRLSASTTLPIAVGEVDLQPVAFPRISAARAPCSVVQVDVARIGGITPWLKTAHLAESFNVAVCPHFLMELHVSLTAAVPNGRWVEYIPQLDDLTSGEDADRERPRCSVRRAGARHRLGLGAQSTGGGSKALTRFIRVSRRPTGGPAGPPLYELIYGVLREHIEDGSFPRGLVLGEAAVARAFSASRVPAAAALRRLHDEGLLQRVRRPGLPRQPASNASPIRLDLDEAGLRLPPALAGDQAHPQSPRAHLSRGRACCGGMPLLRPLPPQRERARRALRRQPDGRSRGARRDWSGPVWSPRT